MHDGHELFITGSEYLWYSLSQQIYGIDWKDMAHDVRRPPSWRTLLAANRKTAHDLGLSEHRLYPQIRVTSSVGKFTRVPYFQTEPFTSP